MSRNEIEELAFEDSLRDDWSRDLETVEISLGRRAGWCVALAAALIIALVGGRVFYLSVIRGGYYTSIAQANVNQRDRLLAPRGLIVDRSGKSLADNQPIFSAVLDLRRFLREPTGRDEVFSAAEQILDISRNDLEAQITESSERDSGHSIVLATDLTQSQIVALSAASLEALTVQNDFKRVYVDAPLFSSVLGYVGLPTSEELTQRPSLSAQDLVGKSGVEAFYDSLLQGIPGTYLKVRDARGNIIREERVSEPKIGSTLTLTIDAEFQKFFVERMQAGLDSLGREAGVIMAMNPQNGEVLALASFPTFDNGILSNSGNLSEKRSILNSETKPLFNRAISGRYSPGSTIKPLHGIAILKEGVIDVYKTIFSPGYLDIPNPYNPSQPTRYLDWRYQGDVDLAAAIAQSSDVYFYETVGGFGNQRGIGITKLREWWQKFRFDKRTGIDLPGEGVGFLPSPEWKEGRDGRPWLLGDTYNVSIGQGDLDITPIQLMSYVTALANGGKIYTPVLNKDISPGSLLEDLSYLAPEIVEVQKGMRQTVTSSLGTAKPLNDLSFPVNAKTGSAQVLNNTQENAFFVGYIPTAESGVGNDSEIAILVLVENAREGSSNTLPIARDALNWYWQNRLGGGS